MEYSPVVDLLIGIIVFAALTWLIVLAIQWTIIKIIEEFG